MLQKIPQECEEKQNYFLDSFLQVTPYLQRKPTSPEHSQRSEMLTTQWQVQLHAEAQIIPTAGAI